MAEIVFTDGFMDDMASAPERVEAAAWQKLSLIESMPGMGSALLSSSLRRRFGDECLKVLVDPYEIVYRWREEADRVEVLALVHQRAARGVVR